MAVPVPQDARHEGMIAAKQALAGALAGATTALMLHPLDTAKTFRQSDPHKYSGVVPTLRMVAASRGFPALYSGLLPAMLGSAPSSAVYFSTYEFSRRRLSKYRRKSNGSFLPRILINMLSAASGNVMSSVLFVPKEVLKQRLQFGLGHSVPEAASILFRESGIRGFYSGYFSTLMRNVPSTALKFMIYEEVKHMFLRFSNKSELSSHEHLAAGALAGLISSFATTPMDVMKTKYATGKGKGLNVFQLLQRTVRDDGIRGLYVGLRPRLIWAALFASIGFASYETFKGLLLGDQSRWIARRPRRPTFRSTSLAFTSARTFPSNIGRKITCR
mmetsp:Transcript_5204/g.15558  ORF Transcript_5204/g.15558 Transcript_5204/m.15558 type:complete len:331 (-) Transcript_5204:74-1066(-)